MATKRAMSFRPEAMGFRSLDFFARKLVAMLPPTKRAMLKRVAQRSEPVNT